MHIIPVPLSWCRGGAAVTAKPRDTLSVSLCFIDVSNCARLRPFRLSGPCGGVCAKQLGNPVDDLSPMSSRACVLINFQMNGLSEPQKNKRAPRGFQPRSQTSQCERKGHAASVPGIKRTSMHRRCGISGNVLVFLLYASPVCTERWL